MIIEEESKESINSNDHESVLNKSVDRIKSSAEMELRSYNHNNPKDRLLYHKSRNVNSWTQTLQQTTHIEENNSCQFVTYKIIACLTTILTLLLFNNLDFKTFTRNSKCFSDNIHILLEPLTKVLSKNEFLRCLFIILSSIMLDITFLFTLIVWAVSGHSWQLMINVLFYYFARSIIQLIYLMRFPELNLFKYPGFPSLVVPYLKTNDFFFSGHVSISLFLGNELIKHFDNWIYVICWCISLYECFVLLVTRGHYSIDVLFAYVFVFYTIRIIRPVVNFLDKFVCIANKVKNE